MEGLERMVEIGKELGLSGEELINFIEKREQLEKEKEEKRVAREEKKEADRLARGTEREAREHKAQVEKLEREERLKDRELKQKELELAHAENVSKLKLQLAEKEIELAEVKKDTGLVVGAVTMGPHDIKAKLPKLPAFCEGKDSMDSYLKRFERFAETAKWPKGEWATNLSALLQGKALDVYSRLASSDAGNYDVLRAALLKRYQLTEEGFRLKFRNCKQEVGETCHQFMVRLDNYLSRWMELGNVKETYEALRDLMLREQFLAVSNKNLVIFLKERKIESATQLVSLADQYMEAHGVSDNMYRLALSQKPELRSETPRVNFSQVNTPDNAAQPRVFKDKVCYNCGKKDHFIRSCPYKTNAKPGSSVRTAAVCTEENSSIFETESENEGISQNDGLEDFPKSVATCVVVTPTHDVCLSTQSMQRDDTMVYSSPLVSILEGQGLCGSQSSMPVTDGFVGNIKVKVLRDSGCNAVIVKNSLIESKQFKSESQTCVLADGTRRTFQIATIQIDTPFFSGEVDALCMENPVYELVIGNISGVRSADDPDVNWNHDRMGQTKSFQKVCAVETRAQKLKKENVSSLHAPPSIREFSKAELIEGQVQDKSIERYVTKADVDERIRSKRGSIIWFCKENGIIYIKYQAKPNDGKVFKQLLVPLIMRNEVLKLAHDSILAGHLGVRKMKQKFLNEFWWPGLDRDVRKYCRSCSVCQKTVPKGRVSTLPLGKMPIIDTPFSRIAIDLIGPIHPPSENGNRFILTVVDYATRYPEAVPLKKIDSETVAEALVDIYSRVGIPREVLTDQGKQFTSDLMKAVGRLLSIKQLTTTPYHPSCNGLVERFNGTLKTMLRRVSEEQPKMWDRFIPSLLFAYRESVQESTGFSPFQLLYGRQVRGPLSILKQIWTKEIEDDEVKTAYQYVVDLRERLEDTCEIVREALEISSTTYKRYADAKSKDRQFKVGDKVLLLLPNNMNKLLMQWKGSFEVIDKMNPYDYKVNIHGKIKTYHGNMLKHYYPRAVEGKSINDSDAVSASCVSVVEDEYLEEEIRTNPLDIGNREVGVHFPVVESQESISDVSINCELDEEQKNEVQNLLYEYSDVFTDIPGSTDIAEHDIVLTSQQPVRCRPYPVPYALKQEIKKEIDNMLRLDIIEPCTSSYASPVVIVKKADGSNRFCCDFRKLNKITVFDAEPMGNPDELFAKMSKSRYFTKLDLSKGYWQIKVKKSCQMLTAFITSEGLFAFKKMPFGLVNAGATFCPMMRSLLRGMSDTNNFVDDIMVHTENWDRHIAVLQELLKRLRDARLTARPTKCIIAVNQVGFLGHVLGNGTVKPNPEKVLCIQNCRRPSTKKQVRSFMGLVGYYRKFIPNFSAISAPLTDLTKKGEPAKVRWNQEQEYAFQTLINLLSKSPILCLPDFEKQFIVRTDASDIGVGAVLLQEHQGCKFPVCYASKKLLEREKAYSVIEKECLAVVWAIKKFQSYLYGTHFLLETDHEPLVYLNKAKCANARLMRWALSLQPFKISIIGIKGKDNAGADFLSRMV